MWAAHRGHSEVVKTLIEAGAAVDHQSLTVSTVPVLARPLCAC